MPNKIKLDEVMKRLPRFVEIVPETYKGMRYNAEFIDIDYNEKFVANVHSVINLQHGCKSRSNSLRSKTNKEKFRGNFGKENMILLEDVKNNLPSFLMIDDISYKGVRHKARFYDKDYDIWFESTPANVLKGRGFCKERRYDNNKIKAIIPLEEVQRRLKDTFGKKYEIISDTYKSMSEKALFKREDGSIIKNTPMMILSGRIDMRKNLEKWKYKVLVRDNWTCQKCGSEENSQAHHIKTFHAYPEGRFDPDNGITLCKKCHDFYHSLYKNEENEENFNSFINKIL